MAESEKLLITTRKIKIKVSGPVRERMALLAAGNCRRPHSEEVGTPSSNADETLLTRSNTFDS